MTTACKRPNNAAAPDGPPEASAAKPVVNKELGPVKRNASEGGTNNNNKNKQAEESGDEKGGHKHPVGGYDASPIPHTPAGWTLKITIHRAENLPMADISSLSSDPYVLTQMYTTNPTRHKDDPPLKMRTFTVRKEVNPEWNADWIVANVPSSGFKLKCRIYDEDPSNHDDRLGNAHVAVDRIGQDWEGFSQRSFRVKKRMASKRAYLVQAVATGLGQRQHMDAHLVVSIKNLGRTESDHGSRLYTVGPMWWTRHFSPLLGRMLNRKTPGKDAPDADEEKPEHKTERYE
jgi:hypothetical protein